MPFGCRGGQKPTVRTALTVATRCLGVGYKYFWCAPRTGFEGGHRHLMCVIHSDNFRLFEGGAMGLPEDLQAVQDLREKGSLTDQEFADAKAAILKKHQEPSSTEKKSSKPPAVRLSFVLVLLAILLFFVGLIWYNVGTKQTTQMVATVVHAPIEVKNEIENLPASSWKGIALNLPYTGTVSIDLAVARGNPLDVFLTPSDQLENMKAALWTQVRVYSDFSASKTTIYKRSGRLRQGNYYLVLRDTSLGVLSASSSDVNVKVRLNP